MSDTIRKVQLKQLELIKKIHEICTEQNIKYTMLGGTLLGAVRHKGFIPWDDDLDIGLPRNDYDRLIEYLKQNPIEGCFLQCYETEKKYIQPFAKLRLDGTTYKEKVFDKLDIHSGVFIDIFPLDKISKPGSRGTEFRRLLCKEITFSIWFKEGCHMKRKGIKRLETVGSAVLSIIPKKALVSVQRKLADREKRNWNYYASIFSSNFSTKKVYFTSEELNELILFDFEDTKLYGTASYDALLSRMFKNYMELPPVEKRSSGHNVVEINV